MEQEPKRFEITLDDGWGTRLQITVKKSGAEVMLMNGRMSPIHVRPMSGNVVYLMAGRH